MVDYGKSKREFLVKEFDIKSIPSKSTLTIIFVMIDPKWIELSIFLLQKTVENKTNEISAVKELIEMPDVKDLVITADAMHCQRETAKTIADNGEDYFLQLKSNSNYITGVDADILEVKNVCNSSIVIPRGISCLIDCIKLFLVNLILSLSEVSTFEVSEGLKSSPVESIKIILGNKGTVQLTLKINLSQGLIYNLRDYSTYVCLKKLHLHCILF